MVDVLSNAVNTIKVYESIGRDQCVLQSTKLVRSLLDVMKKTGYIADFEEFRDGRFMRVKVTLSKKINDIGVIRPRYAVGIDDYQRYETRYIPSKDFGILIVSTSNGIMTNRDAKSQHMGGRLIAYVY